MGVHVLMLVSPIGITILVWEFESWQLGSLTALSLRARSPHTCCRQATLSLDLMMTA